MKELNFPDIIPLLFSFVINHIININHIIGVYTYTYMIYIYTEITWDERVLKGCFKKWKMSLVYRQQ